MQSHTFQRLGAVSLFVVALLLTVVSTSARAAVNAQAGPYRVELSTDPAVVPVGKGKLILKISDAAGKPVEGATVSTLARMPGMNMGEREQAALPQPSQPGVYVAPAAFAMAGAYTVDVKITAGAGPATTSLPLQTGQNTGGAGGASLMSYLPWLVGVLLLLVVLLAVRRSGQRLNTKAIANRQVLGALLLVAVMFAIAIFAVRKWRRPGAMTPIEAQAMDMSLPAPEGTTAVELAVVSRGTVQSKVRYTGQAVGYVEQDVYPRVQGVIEWMPFYAGDRVRRGQVLARLDLSQIAPQVAERRAGARMAEQGVNVARNEYEEALANVGEAESELGMRQGALDEARTRVRQAEQFSNVKRGGLTEARSMERRARSALNETRSALRAARAAASEAQSDLVAAQEERTDAEAAAEAAEAQIVDAQGELQAARADLAYWQPELERMAKLLKEGAVSKEEFQREQAQAETAAAKVRQAESRVSQMQAAARGARARVRRAEAMIGSAQAKARQAEAGSEGGQSRIEQAQADIAASGARIAQANAEWRASQNEVLAMMAKVRQTQSELEAHHAHVRQTSAAAGTARARIAQAGAGVQQAQAGIAGAAATQSYAAIRAQTNGVITQRLISPGVLVSPGQAILRVAQIQPIRLQANVAESDLAKIRVGAPVTIHNQSNPKVLIMSRVTSVTPSVDPSARTGIVEAIVSNRDEKFLPGQYVSMEIATGQSANMLRIPSRAIQWRAGQSGGVLVSDSKPYVWVATHASDNQFTVQRLDVQLGASDGQYTAVLSGLKDGQRVVLSVQQNLQNGDTVSPVGANVTNKSTLQAHSEPTPMITSATAQTVMITVTEKGFEPTSIKLRAGTPARVTFIRKTDATCATEVVIPDFKIRKTLPINKPVVVEFTPKRAGTLTFGCGMDMMLRGQMVVQ